MSPDEVRALRKSLACSSKELAATLGAPAEEVAAWERGERFPTKRWVDALRALGERGPSAVLRAAKRAAPAAARAAPEPLADPAFWALFRKLLAHADLRREVLSLAERYPDPTQLSTKPPPEG